jgi:uncharacterized membrane protein YtjA (UPF0391 family)
MLSWALAFFIIAIIAAVFGFGGIAAGAAGIAKVLFFLFLIAFLVSFIMGWRAGGDRAPPYDERSEMGGPGRRPHGGRRGGRLGGGVEARRRPAPGVSQP